MMIRVFSFCIFILFSTMTMAKTHIPIEIPPHTKDITKQCSCECEDRIAYQNVPVNDDILKKWATEAAVLAYSYGFGNYYSALKNTSYYFTDTGWQSYGSALKSSGNLDAIVKNKMLLTAKTAGQAKITNRGNIDGHAFWQIEIPLTVQYENVNFKETRQYLIRMTVEQSATTAGIRGLGIKQFVTFVQ